MKFLYLKNKRNRILYATFEKKKILLKALFHNLKWNMPFRTIAYKYFISLPKNASITRLKNRCVLTNRSRSIYKKFGLSRLMFREFAQQGFLLGVKKASW